MWKYGLRRLLCALAWVGILAEAGAQSPRTRENFDEGWQFHLGNLRIDRAVKAGQYGGLTDANVKMARMEDAGIAYSDKDKAESFDPSAWRSVDLPHDWCVEGEFVNDGSKVIDGAPSGLVSHGFLPVGIGFYRKEFKIPAADQGKKISIEFDGIFRNSTVWVNGHRMGSHLSGYLPSFYDLTDVLRYGDEGGNVVLVKVDATDYEGWWYEGCGIYRHVWLLKTDPLHVDRFGTFVTTPEVSLEQSSVRLQTTVCNEYDEGKKLTLVSTVVDAEGREVARQETELSMAPSCKAEVVQNALVPQPELWSPESPYLYKVLTEVKDGNRLADTYETVFGIRTVEVRQDGFYLNGKLYPIKGTANHQDFAGVGVALPDKLHAYRVKLLKEMGCNAYRTAHNPTTPELMDICDREGMLFMDENRLLSSTEEGLKDLETLVLRDRNHPSVFMWCIENEEPLEGTPMGTRILRTMARLVKRLDPTRQITAGMNHGWNEAGYADVLDVVGYNYGQRKMQYVNDKKNYPGRLMIVTESTSFVSTRGEYEDNKAKGYVSNMGNGVGWGMLPGHDWKHIVQYPFLSGMFAWTGFDYRGEPTPIYQWPTVTSHFGIMDMCGFPKDGYYAYKAAWTDEPVVHIFPHWTLPSEKIGQTVKLMGYTNCDEVELKVNGKRIGRKKVAPYERMEWETTYRPGKIEAIGYKNGKKAVRKVVETTGQPARIGLSPDVKQLRADGCDVAVVNVSILDSKGRVVPVADNMVHFSVKGPGKIIGTGNGDPSSHEPDKASRRKAFNGYCQVLVQAEKEVGEICLTASSDGLEGAEVKVSLIR